MALSPSYACFSVSRLFSGLTSSFSQTVPPATIADIFIKEVRGHKMSMYAVAVVIAPAVAPLFSGIIVAKTNWHVLFWLVLGLAVVQCLLYFFVVPETLWNEDFSTPLQSTDAQPTAPSPEPSESYNKDDSSKPVIRHLEEAHQDPMTMQGHVGPAWMPWQRPMEYLQVCLSPFLMVSHHFSLPSLIERHVLIICALSMTASLYQHCHSFHLLRFTFCLVHWHHHCHASKV